MKAVWRAAGLFLAVCDCQAARNWEDLSAPREWSALNGAPVALAPEGRLLPIVHDGKTRHRRAANFLAQILAKRVGQRPPVYEERKGQRAKWPRGGLFVGEVSANRDWFCALTNESADAFRVVASDRAVRFLGRADYAVFDWCERALGLRYYCEDGLCAETNALDAVEAVDYSDAPAYECRQLDWRTPSEWLTVAKYGNTHRGGVAVHQPANWFRDEAVRAAHPSVFETGETPMLCYGKAETLAYYKERIDRHIAGLQDSGGIVDTNRKVVTVCQWDAPVRCACAACRPLYTTELGFGGKASPVLWGRFTRQLAHWLKAAHPDYEISFLPYLNTCEVPRKWVGRRGFPRHRRAAIDGLAALANAEAEVCTMPGLALLKEPDCRRNEERILREWQRVTGRKVLCWHYSCWPADWTSAPYVYGRTIQGHCKRMRGVSCGTFVCGDANDARQTLSHYVWAKCLWNPDLDVEKVYDGFARRLFGAAAKPMRELIALQEEGWERRWKGLDCTYDNIFERSYPRANAERMRELLIEARNCAERAGDTRAVRRIERYASGFNAFLRESDALSARTEAERHRRIPLGATNEMVAARSVLHPRPRFPTTIVTGVAEGALILKIRCEEPAAATMDFVRGEVENFIWGNDKIDIFLEGREGLAVWPTGRTEGEISAHVTHDGTSWSVLARVGLTAEERARGSVRGNVCRWRVGDVRKTGGERVAGSRYEHTRLNTCYTQPNEDPAAFVEFLLK